MRGSVGHVRDAAVAAFLGLAMVGTAACTVSAAGNDPATGTGTAVAEPVRAGCQGGFTGGGSGVRIDADDHLVRWSQATAGATEEATDMGADPALAAEVRQHLDAIGFTTIDYSKPSNMTCFVSYRGHTVAWPIGDADAPAAVVAIHQQLTGSP